jgi:hypothetical protein
MRNETKALSLAITMGLSMATAAASAAEPRMTVFAPGQETRGEITSADILNWRDGTRSELFSVALKADQGVRFEVEGPLRAQLSLYLDGQLVRSSSGDDGKAALAVRASRAGRYVLAVSGSDPSAYGPFTLASTELRVYSGGELAADDSISDWLDGEKRIPLRIAHDGMYTIRMSSDEFDTVLGLEGNGVALGSDDADGSNSQLTARLAAGQYTLVASGYSGQAGGQYALAIAETTLPAGVDVAADGELVAGSDVTAVYQGQPVSYRLRVAERQLLELDMRSSELDSKLQLTGNGIQLEDDDGGERLDARIASLVAPGDYTVRVSAFNQTGGAGVFTLSARLSAVPADAGGGVLEIGRRHGARLMPGMTDRYTFSVARAGTYVFTMASADGVDPFLRLVEGGETLATDDDGGGALDARIEHALEAGDYVLEASSAMGGDGRYEIQAQRR